MFSTRARNTLILILTLILLSNNATAGLDTRDPEGFVVATFNMQNGRDSGPREYIADSVGTFTQGKIEKALNLNGKQIFRTEANRNPFWANGEFTISAWVKCNPNQSHFYIVIQGWNISREESYYVSMDIENSGNLRGEIGGRDDKVYFVRTQNKNLADGKWHHLTFSYYAFAFRLFIDGKPAQHFEQGYLGNLKADVSRIRIDTVGEKRFNNVQIDELVMLEEGISEYEVKGLMRDGIKKFLQTMPVDPKDKVSTTWGTIKRDRNR